MPMSGIDPRRTAKAWVQFNGNSMTIVNSFNVSSLTDLGVGDYTVNLGAGLNFPIGGYVALTNAGSGDSSMYWAGGRESGSTQTAFNFSTGTGSRADMAYVSALFF